MKKGLRNESGRNIGHFVFEWGQKQERTPTWYGMFHKDGQAMSRVDEVTRFWSGKYPPNRAPRVWSILMNNLIAESSVQLKTLNETAVEIVFDEPDIDPVEIVWELSKEVGKRSQGGAKELEPDKVPLNVIKTFKSNTQAKLVFLAPKQAGEYRLFCYVYDNKQKVGYANFPFLVK